MSKAKGSRGEHKVMRRLESEEYKCTRAAASLGIFDIIAIGPHLVRLIQVKVGKNPYANPVERAAIEEFKCPPFCTRELWLWKDRSRNPVVKVAPFGGE